MSNPRADDLFLSLTPERVLHAVEAGGHAVTGLCYPLNSFENRVYEVELADRSRVIAKFYRPGRWSEEQILAEHRFLEDLAADEIPVVPMRRFADGSTLARIEEIWYSLADRRGGRAPAELNDELALRLGRLVGRLHNVGARKPAAPRLKMTADAFIGDALAWLAAHRTLPEHLETRYRAAALGIAAAVDAALLGVPTFRIHADLHLGNLLEREGLLHIIDFDDMVEGPAVQDLWLALPGRDAETLARRDLFLDGYRQFREFDRAWLALIEPLRGLRLIHYATWLARRWHDPAFPAAWPWFGTPDYWNRETEDLEEQLAVIRGEVEAARIEDDRAAGREVEVKDEAPELTNKDFFWDWEGN